MRKTMTETERYDAAMDAQAQADAARDRLDAERERQRAYPATTREGQARYDETTRDLDRDANAAQERANRWLPW
jgi:hypothetical protein